MNDLHKLTIDDIEVGERLPWSILDKYGRLMLEEGGIINNVAQAKDLVAAGIYIEETLYTKLPSYKKNTAAIPAATSQPGEIIPVLFNINQAVLRLDALLKNIKKFPDARKNILEIFKLILSATQQSEDLALASVQLNHQSGSYGVRHCVDTAILAIIVARTMNKSGQEIQDIAAAALTMNISMTALQERLQTQKEELTEADKAAIHNHPIDSIDVLFEAGIEDPEWLKYVLLHHEHEDGTGYPVGTVSGEIPQNAKILSLADGFCARISSRGYRRSTLPSVALRDIFIENSAHADATLASYFVKVLGLYPPGTFVMLKNKEVAVISHRGSTPTNCTAYSLVKPSGELFSNPIKRDTASEVYRIDEAIYPTDAAVRVNLQQIWGPIARM
jgi:HD-GYP domain-containing protein (c-di-GMP phosphodiesterase class II)